MKVQLVNFHCVITWAIHHDELAKYRFATTIQRGRIWANLVVIRERRLK